MKKILVLTVMAFAIVASASAQEKKVSFGVRAGVNFSNLDYSYSGEDDFEYDFKSRTGFNFGVVMDWNVARNFYIQPGLYFTTRGAKFESSEKYDDESYSYTEKYNANYLQLPVMASYRFPVSNTVKVDISAGPYVAFGLNGKIKSEWTVIYDGEKDSGSEKEDLFKGNDGMKAPAKKFDAGLRFGAGVHFSKYYAGLSYDLGLSNVLNTGKSEEYVWSTKEKAKNGNFSITLGYNF